MLRQIIEIDEDLCIGCELCISACNEGAIGIVDGKAKLLRDDYCDGLGNCLPNCPTGAISFIQKETLPFDKAAVLEKMKKTLENENVPQVSGGCPGSAVMSINRNSESYIHEGHGCCSGDEHSHDEDHDCQCEGSSQKVMKKEVASGNNTVIESELRQWPVQIKLMPLKSPLYENANLLIAADCAAYAYGDFHRDFMRNKVAIIGCPKLDDGDYTEKLTEIIRHNDIKSVTIVRMQVPCCGGLERAGKMALQASGKFIPWNVVTISTDGRIIE